MVFLTNYPRSIAYFEYENAISHMIDKLRQQKGIVSIYQIGSVSTPGVSDIDLLVVFEDDAKCYSDPRHDLTRKELYLYPHALYGCSASDFIQAQEFTYFHNYKLLWGNKLPIQSSRASTKDDQASKTQTALEYLIRMFINRKIEEVYGIIKVREILLHTKALLFDLEFLDIYSGRLFELIETVIDWRNNWFEKKVGKRLIRSWFLEFNRVFTSFLNDIFKKQLFYLPDWVNHSIGRNIKLFPSKEMGYVHKGITLPSQFGIFGKKVFNFQHRFNKFIFYIPTRSKEIPECLIRRFAFLREMKRQNRARFPHFMAMTSGLNVL